MGTVTIQKISDAIPNINISDTSIHTNSQQPKEYINVSEDNGNIYIIINNIHIKQDFLKQLLNKLEHFKYSTTLDFTFQPNCTFDHLIHIELEILTQKKHMHYYKR